MMRILRNIFGTIKHKIYGGVIEMYVKELSSQCAEPVDIWRNVSNHNLLQLLYNDLSGRNFLFESYVQLCRLKMHTEAPPSDVQFIERSIQNNRFVFIEAAHRDKLLSDPEYVVLCKWYDWISANMDVSLDLIVYLQCPPEVAFQRMLSRGRSEEKSKIPLDYMKKIHDTYEDWLINQTFQTSLPPVLVVNTEKDLSEVGELCYKARDILCGKIKLTKPVTSLEMVVENITKCYSFCNDCKLY
ncbi:hypothetical protein J437_LFUL000370 [Ladona fulva]|uniref:Deoxynucleoside kinase domain-containing protein n=1 Tax=Ladona fulva TaxID=123851 RepID=A0A8K0NXB1_LADFU|nr:hypothetical protein J437_LFUL000370 [Ladona fulva]